MLMGSIRCLATGLVFFVASGASAQSPAEFYKGKTVEVYVGYSVGGGYDLYARVLARHMGKHIPGNPTLVPKNMEGAASLRLANWLAKAAPKDGSVFGTVGRGLAFDPLLGLTGALYKATDFTWLGSANDEVSICASWHTSGISKFDDVFTEELLVGANGVSDDTVQYPKALNAVLGTKFKIVSGYPGGNDVVMAMERGEVQGRCGWSWTSVVAAHEAWLVEKKINVLVQLALEKHPDLPDVPLATDMAKTEEQSQILRLILARQVMGRPFMAPPGVPKDRAEALRQAFTDTMKDPDFLADAAKSKLEVRPVSGAKVEALVKQAYDTPASVAKMAGAALN